MAQLHGVELPNWVQPDGPNGLSVVLPDGQKLGFRVSVPDEHTPARIADHLWFLELAVARRGWEPRPDGALAPLSPDRRLQLRL